MRETESEAAVEMRKWERQTLFLLLYSIFGPVIFRVPVRFLMDFGPKFIPSPGPAQFRLDDRSDYFGPVPGRVFGSPDPVTALIMSHELGLVS